MASDTTKTIHLAQREIDLIHIALLGKKFDHEATVKIISDSGESTELLKEVDREIDAIMAKLS